LRGCGDNRQRFHFVTGFINARYMTVSYHQRISAALVIAVEHAGIDLDHGAIEALQDATPRCRRMADNYPLGTDCVE
jgi:hypothetical protein